MVVNEPDTVLPEPALAIRKASPTLAVNPPKLTTFTVPANTTLPLTLTES